MSLHWLSDCSFLLNDVVMEVMLLGGGRQGERKTGMGGWGIAGSRHGLATLRARIMFFFFSPLLKFPPSPMPSPPALLHPPFFLLSTQSNKEKEKKPGKGNKINPKKKENSSLPQKKKEKTSHANNVFPMYLYIAGYIARQCRLYPT